MKLLTGRYKNKIIDIINIQFNKESTKEKIPIEFSVNEDYVRMMLIKRKSLG